MYMYMYLYEESVLELPHIYHVDWVQTCLVNKHGKEILYKNQIHI